MRNLQEKRKCLQCGKEHMVKQSVLRKGHGKFCSNRCKNLWFWKQPEYKELQSKVHKGNIPVNIEWLKENASTPKHIEKIRKANKGREPWNKGLRTKEPSNRHSDSFYGEWRRQVYKRDNWKCRINNCNCSGRIEAHHILRWSKFPELRYEVNNGITLCVFHHPRKIKDEKRLIQTFRELVLIEK